MLWVNMDTKGNLTPKPVKFEGDDCGISTLCFTGCNWLPDYLITFKMETESCDCWGALKLGYWKIHLVTRVVWCQIWPLMCVPSLCKPFSGGWGTYCWRTKIPALFYFLFIREWCINSVYPSLPILIMQSWYFSFSKLLLFDIVTVWNSVFYVVPYHVHYMMLVLNLWWTFLSL